MSTALHDFPSQIQVAASLAPGSYVDNQNGTAVDLIAADGRGFAVLFAGSVAGGTTAAAKLQDSADGTTWADITGAAFTNVTAGPAVQTLAFDRARRYVRAAAT